MLGALHTARQKLLTPHLREASFEVRGFRADDDAARARLEKIGRTFLTGYAEAARSGSASAVDRDLARVETAFQGFAYEGAAMALTVLDALSPRGGHRVADLLAGGGDRHAYMIHVGVGWALARLPVALWRRVLPADPLLGWLALDGFGFHQAYFHTARHVTGRQRIRMRWPGDTPRPYASHALDQGIGRALWFVEGADPVRVAAAVRRFSPSRHADLFSGVGLAATYAGGTGADGLRVLRDAAGEHRPQLAQGAAFAAQARVRADLVTAHTAIATEVLCGAGVAEAAAVTDQALAGLPTDGPRPAFAVWRERIAHHFTATGRYEPCR
jgi:hypothetical protein